MKNNIRKPEDPGTEAERVVTRAETERMFRVLGRDDANLFTDTLFDLLKQGLSGEEIFRRLEPILTRHVGKQRAAE